jgi:hypothetical protein
MVQCLRRAADVRIGSLRRLPGCYEPDARCPFGWRAKDGHEGCEEEGTEEHHYDRLSLGRNEGAIGRLSWRLRFRILFLANVRNAGDGQVNPVVDLIDWCKRERESLQMQREMLQSKAFRIFKEEDGHTVDMSDESIERITASMKELDQIFAAYAAKRF